MKSINLGIVGLGYWGPNYARIINELDNVNLSWCCDVNVDTLNKFSKLYPNIKTSTSIEDLIKDPNLDGTIIVTPAQTHYEIAQKFLASSKNVLIEKPLTNNLADAKKLVNLAKIKKRVLMVDHTFQFNAAIIKLKELIKNKKLGTLYYIYGNYNALGPIRRDVSVIWDLPHFIYVVNFLTDSTPLSVIATGKAFLQEKMTDIAFLTLEYPGGILFNLNCSWLDPVKVRKLVVVGQKKMAVFNDLEIENKLTIYNRGLDINSNSDFTNLQLILRSGDTLIPKLNFKEPLKEVILQFVKSIPEGNTHSSGGVEGTKLVEILEAAQASIDKGGQKIWLRKK